MHLLVCFEIVWHVKLNFGVGLVLNRTSILGQCGILDIVQRMALCSIVLQIFKFFLSLNK